MTTDSRPHMSEFSVQSSAPSEQLDRALQPDLEHRRQAQLYRSRVILASPQGPEAVIDGRPYLCFCSNDYLGLAADRRVRRELCDAARQFGVGSGASHLIIGHSQSHHALEEELAAFVGRERALLFSTGYMANLAIATALVGRSDALFEDRLNHASLIDAALLSRARLHRYRHADASALGTIMASSSARRKLVLTDGVFSMDGDIAPLPELAGAAASHQGWLVVDDAHGLGVLGPSGRGSVEHHDLRPGQVPVLMGTLGKGFGTFGAFVAGSENLVETLVQQARPYIYTTALPPAIAAATRVSLRIAEQEPWRRDKVYSLVQRFRRGARQLGLKLPGAVTPIQPLVLGATDTTLRAARSLRERGIYVSPIRPPTVPAGSSRLRLTFTAAHRESHVDRLLDALDEVFS